MDGVGAVYHLAPNVHPDEVVIASRVVESACAAGVSRFAFHSVLHPHDTSMPHHLRKAEAERAVRARLGAATVLRPAAYHQNLVEAALRGRLEVPYSVDTRFTNVDLDDIAEVAALVLSDQRHAGATYDLAGPEALSVRELAGTASATLGRPVDATTQAIGDWLAGPGAGLPRQARDDLAAMFRAYDRDGLVGDSTTLADLLGRPPHTWGEVLRTASTASAR
ncbi:NmrA family NAD(P)-binding protein [Monashia sp. NPDC004114]